MLASERKRAAIKFAADWEGKGSEKAQSQPFWLSLLRDVFGVPEPEKFIFFETQVKLDKTSFIDAYIPETHVLIEQKSLDKKLDEVIRQSDGSFLTPIKQAKRYAAELPYSERPRYIVTSNFQSFWVYDMEKPTEEPEKIELKDFAKVYHRLGFLVDGSNAHIKRETDLSIEAGEIVGLIYDEILRLYHTPVNEHSLKSLNKICVRLVFCLYAEDAGIFGREKQFHDYLARFEPRDLRQALQNLFKVLNTKIADRDPYLDSELAAFPYVNGELFDDEDIEIPQLDEQVKNLLMAKARDDFDWSDISPTIFGAVFESTLNPETRRSGGMHYTSIENIHKVIDPLFLDDLKEELKKIVALKTLRIRRTRLEEFQNKLASLKFLDPACGSGNFLTESYLALRRLENDVLMALSELQIFLNLDDPIKVSIKQFFGIEINDFAVSVAKTALWIAESQMIFETEKIVQKTIDFLPLSSSSNIVEANALQIDWADIVPNTELHYIMGNPPFSGARVMSSEQKQDLLTVFAGTSNAGNLDYVTCWFRKAADFMHGTSIEASLVATNSITQGEQVAIFWPSLLADGFRITYAYRTFRWDSEAKSKAKVHCVIVGFKQGEATNPVIFTEDGERQPAENVNPYLIDAPNVVVSRRKKPLWDAPTIGIGNKPIDDGNYLFTEEEKSRFIREEPASAQYFKRWYGAEEFINGKNRYVLWLGDCPPNILRTMPKCLQRVEAVRNFRLRSKSPGTVKIAQYPTRFHVENISQSVYVLIPKVSSERRFYVPMGFVSPDIFCGDAAFVIPDANLYHFGVLTSLVHMAWMRVICGRLESRYRYSKDVVYNNFPWPAIIPAHQKRIEKTAADILETREHYPDSSLADLYDERTMPPELRKAHHANDHAVLKAYGFNVNITETGIVAELMQLYEVKSI